MEKIKVPIIVTTLVLFAYNILPFISVPFFFIFLTLLLLTGLTIYMVIKILKDGEAPESTFEDQWYEDVN
ncbi:MAG: hypothetical protein R3345_05575 [Fulvivirga sp.]|nr:hypothetical protein [Fulvivirga sp.]